MLYILFAVAAFSACSDDNQGEVVSQDLSYQLDANYVFVDIPEKFLFDPSNILYLEGKTVMKLNAKSDGKQTTITEGTEFTFNVKLKKALNQNVKVRLKKNLDLLEGHTLTEFPDEAFELNDAIITAGSREGTITLNITNPDILNKLPGYVLPLRLEFVDAVSGVKISKQSYNVLIEINLKLRKTILILLMMRLLESISITTLFLNQIKAMVWNFCMMEKTLAIRGTLIRILS